VHPSQDVARRARPVHVGAGRGPVVGRTAPGLFGTVVRPRKAELVLCTRAELSFGPVAI
jgi:hypothetical protein